MLKPMGRWDITGIKGNEKNYYFIISIGFNCFFVKFRFLRLV